jgi:hypothetical protein
VKGFWDKILRTICLGCFKLWSPWSLPPEQLGLQAWATGAQLSPVS